MKKIDFNSLLPYVVALAIFILIPVIYFSPVLDGKRIRAHDTTQYMGMSKKVVDYRKATGDEPLWTDAMFSGMPAYQISLSQRSNKVALIDKVFHFMSRPISFVFTYFVGFFILLIALGVNPWLSIVGAIAFGFSSYFFIIIDAGHNSKAIAIGYMAPIIAGVLLSFKKKYLLGAAITGLFLALNLRASHPQITYYTLFIILIIGLVELYNAFKTKEWSVFFKAVGAQIIPVTLAVMTTATLLLTTMEYSKETIRGKSELTTEKDNKSSGLDKDYITSWSYGKMETFTFLIPYFQGGGSGATFDKNSETFKQLKAHQATQYVSQFRQYWGPQPMTSGPVYMGAIICFLFVLGLFLIKGSMKWWIVAATVLSILLGWGRFFMFFTDFFIDFVPMYNKFRTVTMILVIAELTIPLLGFLALNDIIKGKIDRNKITKALLYSTAITGGLTLLFILLPGLAGNFMSDQEAASNLPEWLSSALIADRTALLRKDAFRSLLLILAAAGVIYLFIKEKLKTIPSIAIIGILIVFDLWSVDKRYLNDDDFNATEKNFRSVFVPSAADKYILSDKAYSRVLNLTVSPFNDASTSYFHNSIGGYHGAKLKRYQEFIEHQLQQDIGLLTQNLQNKDADFNKAFDHLNGLNMLNTKYIIVNPASAPLINPNAMGAAWFVNNVKLVEDADSEISEISKIDVNQTAVVDKRFKDLLTTTNYKKDSTATINMTEHLINKVTYKTDTKTPQFAVFSEIYYSKGWKVTIDGEKVDYARTNYILRGLEIPSGDHTIVFSFEPESYAIGNNISLASSILLLLLCLGIFGFEIKNYLTAKD